MPFEFPGFETEPPKASKFDTRMASQLVTAIKEKTKLKRKYSIAKWANSIRLLRQETSKARIVSAMNWYCENVGGEFVPQAYSAAGFREKFASIEAAMKRAIGPEPDNVTISKHAAAIAGRLVGKTWPKGAADQLPAVVQRSLDNVAALRQRLCQTKFPTDTKASVRAKRVQDWLVDAFPNSLSLVENHYADLWKRVVDWAAWNGRLKPITDDELLGTLRTACAAYCGDGKRVDTLMELTHEN